MGRKTAGAVKAYPIMEYLPITEYPKVSVIIPVYNGEKTLARCLDSLLGQQYPGEKMEIIVVDNHSTDHTGELVRQYLGKHENVKYIPETRRGVSVARNRGIRNAQGGILLFTDADCIADANLVLEHVYAHLYFQKHDPSVKAIGGGVAGENRNFWAVCDDFSSWYLFHPNLPPRFFITHPTANLSIARDIIDSIDLFDENLHYAEDYVFCAGLLRKGYRVYFHPPAVIRHINRVSFRMAMKHSHNWAKAAYQIREKGFVRRDFLKNIPHIVFYYFFVYIHRQMFDLLYYAFCAKRYYILLCFPWVWLIRIQFFLCELKEEIRFFRDQHLGMKRN
jgi:glycosyltransferase involved in cell wall biosynthesis